jgi:hypothetical protein
MQCSTGIHMAFLNLHTAAVGKRPAVHHTLPCSSKAHPTSPASLIIRQSRRHPGTPGPLSNRSATQRTASTVYLAHSRPPALKMRKAQGQVSGRSLVLHAGSEQLGSMSVFQGVIPVCYLNPWPMLVLEGPCSRGHN